MKKLYRTSQGANTGSYNVNPRPNRECAHVEVFKVTVNGALVLNRTYGTSFDEVLGGLKAMTHEEALQFACENNAEQGWKAGDQVAGQHVELQG